MSAGDHDEQAFFRREALEHRQRGWLGEVQLSRPLSGQLLTVLVLLAAVAVGAFLVWGQYTRKAHVVGFLSPDLGVLRLRAQEGAVVAERRASEGAQVRQGDVLFVLRVDRSTLGGDTEANVRRSLAERERSLDETLRQREALARAQDEALARRIRDMQRELVQMEGEAALHRQRLALGEAALKRLQDLQAQNFISDAQVQAKAEEVIGIQAAMQALQRERAGQMREIGVLESERRELPLRRDVTRGEIERDLSALAEEGARSDARRTIVVRAPHDGVLSAVIAEPGQSVAAGGTLASLVPDGAKLEAHLFASSTAVGFLRPAQQVQLRYQAYPYQKFGHQPGRVLQVSRTPLLPDELADLPLPGAVSGSTLGAGAEPLYRITVALDAQTVQAFGHAQPLTAGMQLDADVLLERRRLIEWIFEPLLGLGGRV